MKSWAGLWADVESPPGSVFASEHKPNPEGFEIVFEPSQVFQCLVEMATKGLFIVHPLRPWTTDNENVTDKKLVDTLGQSMVS